MNRGATFSRCRKYRYALWRIWDEAAPRALFIGLNPSTADAEQDDPTIRRCIGFAQRMGCGGVVVVNLFAYRATKPRDLFLATDPVGPRNAFWISKFASETAHCVACWGDHGDRGGEANHVRSNLKKSLAADVSVRCFGLTKSGRQPRHPLYLKYGTPLVPLDV